MVPKYIFASLIYYRKDHENAEFEQRAQNFEPLIRYMVEQETTTQGIRMSRGVELVLVTRQETVVLPKVEPIVAQGVPMAIRAGYNEPKLN